MIARTFAFARLRLAADSAPAADGTICSGVICGNGPRTSGVRPSKCGAVCGAEGRLHPRVVRFPGRLSDTDVVPTLERGREGTLP